MSIESITTEELRHMKGKEGLILQGCGGDLNEWLDGINDALTQENILLEGTKFPKALSFRHEGHTCLLFPMDETVKLNMGKLALWRIGTHHVFSGKWLSDFVHNRLGGFARDQPEQQRPDCPLIGANGNIYNLLGIAANTLRENGLTDQAKEMLNRAFQCGSYEEALGVIGEYVNITDGQGEDAGMDMDI